MPGNTFQRFVAEHRAIMGQTRWVSEWVGRQAVAKQAGDAIRYHVDGQSQLRNVIADLKHGLEYHYSLEESLSRPLMPQTAEAMSKEHESVLQLMDEVECLLRNCSPESAELGRVVGQMFQTIELHNAEEETAFRQFEEVHEGETVLPGASLPCFAAF